MGNVLLQTPTAIFGFQPYVTAGIGLYREELGPHEDTDVGLNLGGGTKITLVGPLKLRLDYRVFRLGNGALNSPAHRVYAGLTLAF
jgi:opacity protein-like surface antigen